MNKEQELKELLEEFKKYLRYGWDAGIIFLNVNIRRRKIPIEYDKVLSQLINLYWLAYEFDTDNDVDGGTCGLIRKNVVDLILNIESEWWNR